MGQQIAQRGGSRLDSREIINDLMDRYGTEVLHLTYTYVRNRQTAEDLTQEIFIKCFEKLYTFEGKASIETWLYRITVNHFKDYVKSWYHRKIVVTDYISSFFTAAPHSGADEAFLEKEKKNEVLEAVYHLPLKYREIIFLYYFKEWTQKEISEICELNLSTVKARLIKAKTLLKERMLERGDGDERGA
jgi:RNA polymerase sigma-70 factor, ECF subfamily